MNASQVLHLQTTFIFPLHIYNLSTYLMVHVTNYLLLTISDLLNLSVLTLFLQIPPNILVFFMNMICHFTHFKNLACFRIFNNSTMTSSIQIHPYITLCFIQFWFRKRYRYKSILFIYFNLIYLIKIILELIFKVEFQRWYTNLHTFIINLNILIWYCFLPLNYLNIFAVSDWLSLT